MNNKGKNVRESALDILEAIEKNQAYSNLLLNKTIKKNDIPAKDVGLLTEIVYGTLQRKMTLDFYLQPFLQKSKKLEGWVVSLLRLTLYQLIYLDRIPDHAAINEAVEIAKKRGHKGIAGLVNGVLRNVLRQGIPKIEGIKDPIERLSIETSHPKWLIKRWVDQLGYEETNKMCQLNLLPPVQTARVHIGRITVEQCISRLQEEGFQVQKSNVIPESIHCLKGNLAHSLCYKDGFITIQDESSMIVAYALDVNAETPLDVLDACAAPGGKTTHIAEKMDNKGTVLAVDLHEHKVKLIRDHAHRLHLDTISTITEDSRKLAERFQEGAFDRILLDAPCSGFGVMRRKPDSKYSKTEMDVERLQQIQLQLLSSVSSLLKKGGVLVYSTCTIDQAENEEVVQRFLQENDDFDRDITLQDRIPQELKKYVAGNEIQVLPQYVDSDGFFIAALRKKVQ